MEYVRYYPLISVDTARSDLQPMTPTDKLNVVSGNHRFWLTEVVPGRYRLGTSEKPSVETVNGFRIRCPKCGAVMRQRSIVSAERPFPLSSCDRCG